MAVNYYVMQSAPDCLARHTGVKYYIEADTAAELPTTYAADGDTAVTFDAEKKKWRRIAGAWVEQTNYSSGGGATLPAGIILMWYGLIAAIPTGWVLCDGANGTPDLRGRYPKGAAAAAQAGDVGGAATHTHAAHASHTHTYTEVVNHTHAVNITDPGHSHTMVEGTTDGSGDFVDRSNAAAASNIVTSTATTGITATTSNPAGGVATGTTAGPSASLTHDTTNSEPPFRTVLFIMKTA